MIRCGKTALVTGATGQDGSYLIELLLSKGYEVHALVRRRSRFTDLETRQCLHVHHGDLSDPVGLRDLVAELRPDECYNLAAMSHVGASFEAPVHTAQVNALGVVAILEAIRTTSPDTRFYQASTSELFGQVACSPQDESTPFGPRSPYACAKAYAHWQTVNYRQAYGLFCCCGICFNHEGPRRSESFVTRKITRAATRIKEGLQDKLHLGNLDAERDWGFAGEYVAAMHLMLQADQPEDYVIATGESHTVEDFARTAFALVGLDWEEHVISDARNTRPAEVDHLRGDATKARQLLGWEPRVRFHELVRMMVEADWALARREQADGVKVSRAAAG